MAAPIGDVARGEQKSKPCAACHGMDGNKTVLPAYPRLGGQYPDYLVKALQDYKSGARSNRAVMAAFASGLSDQDMADLAAYFASQTDGGVNDLRHLQ